MTDKFFQFVDNLQIVRVLQALAAALFVLGLINVFILLPRYLDTDWANLGRTAGAIHNISMYLVQVFYQPLILLALAEIVKILKNKKS